MHFGTRRNLNLSYEAATHSTHVPWNRYRTLIHAARAVTVTQSPHSSCLVLRKNDEQLWRSPSRRAQSRNVLGRFPLFTLVEIDTRGKSYLREVARDGGADELGELVVADLTPLGIIADLFDQNRKESTSTDQPRVGAVMPERSRDGRGGGRGGNSAEV